MLASDKMQTYIPGIETAGHTMLVNAAAIVAETV